MPQQILIDVEDDKLLSRFSFDDSSCYRTNHAKRMDIAFQALQKGYIPVESALKFEIQNTQVTDLYDNYSFLFRYFGRVKTCYVLIIRLLTLNNPLAEIVSFARTIRTKRIRPFLSNEVIDENANFESELIKHKPLVSVVIPTLNRYAYLKDVLADLELQTYEHFEVLICDQSEPIDKTFYLDWKLNLTLIEQKEKALWLARNRCIKASKGDYILLFDDDSRVNPDWIEQHIRCLDYYKSSISAGVTHTIVGHGLSSKETYFHLSDVFDTGNVMVKRSVFEAVGLFDRQFEKQRMGDGEFGLRAILGGFICVSNPKAKRIHLKVDTGGLREMGSWDAWRPKKILSPRPVPSVLYFIRKYFGNQQAQLYILSNVPYSFVPYRFKKSSRLKLLSLLFMPIIFPLVIWTIMLSWMKSNQKLKLGALIETI